jgi:hypothetical protein
VDTGQTANYSMPRWKNQLKHAPSVAIMCFGQDPPDEISFEFRDADDCLGFIYDPIGRFVYLELTKKF